MKIALYARVSATDQNCEMQLWELRDYAAMCKWTIHAEYVDTECSGAKACRPELNRLMADARKWRFDADASGSSTDGAGASPTRSRASRS
jgi:DNA invertase Pin-like site-specific DNA recombinase